MTDNHHVGVAHAVVVLDKYKHNMSGPVGLIIYTGKPEPIRQAIYLIQHATDAYSEDTDLYSASLGNVQDLSLKAWIQILPQG